MNGKIVGAVVVVIVVVGGWYLLSSEPVEAPSSETVVTNQMPVLGSSTPEMIVENATPDVAVAYTDQGFSPQSITVPLGTKVTFTNQSSVNMWVASAMHPTHMVYSGTNLSQHCPDTTGTAFDACAATAPGGTYSFTFTKEGNWKYHDHVDASKFGSITVTAPTTASVEVSI